jgi:hypothetical protein
MELLSKEEVVRHMWLLRQLATFFGKDEAARLCRPPPARACPRTGDHRGGGRAAQDEAIYSCTGARASTFYLSHKETMSMPINLVKASEAICVALEGLNRRVHGQCHEPHLH